MVIIGSGLGGLLCGAMLARNGRKVAVLEKHHQIGGNLQTFKRKDALFNSAMHYVGAMEPGQIMHRIFSYLGVLDSTGLVKLDPQDYERIYLGDKVFSYAGGIEAHRQRLLEYFPEEQSAIDAYLGTIMEVWNSTRVLNLQDFTNLYEAETQYTQMNAYDWIDSLTENQELKDLWGVTSALYAGVPSKSPLITHAIIALHYIQGAYKFDRGSDTLANALASIISSAGGNVLTGSEVCGLRVEDRLASAAVLADESEVRGQSFISNIHPALTAELLEPGIFRKAYVNRIGDLENTMGAFCLYLSLKRRQFKNINANVFIADRDQVWSAGNYRRQKWPGGCILYTGPDPQDAEYAGTMVISSFMDYQELRQWENTGIERRGFAYKEFKKQKAEQLLNFAEIRIPGIRDAVEDMYTATPLTLRDYTATPGGSAYGILKDCNNPRRSYISPQTRVENLFLTGQNSGVGLHGVLGVSVSALFTCANFLDIRNLLKEIRDA